MPTEVIYTLEEDKQEIHKQLGCMNGIFQIFDRRYLLGQRRHGNHHKKLPQGKSVTHTKFNNASDKLKVKVKPRLVVYIHHLIISTMIIFKTKELSFGNSQDQGPNAAIKEKQRESVESSRNSFSSTCSSLDCCKLEPACTHTNNKHDMCVGPGDNIRDVVKDSMTRKPRAVPVKTVAKDGRKGPTMTHVDSPRLLQQHPKPVTYERRDQNLVKHKEMSILVSRGVKDVKESSRFSYDDRVSPYKLQSYANIKDYPRLSLDSHKSSIKHNANVIDQSPTREPISNKSPPSSVVARLMGLDVKNCGALITKPCLDDEKVLVSNALTRSTLGPAPWKQEVEKQSNMQVKKRSDQTCQSVYGHTGKKLTEVGLRTSVKDLRALQKVEKVNPGKEHGRHLTPAGTKATGKTKKQVSPSQATDCLTGVGPRHQRSKIRKQSNRHLIVLSSKTRDRSCRDTRHIRNLSEESDASVASQNEPDVDSKGRTRENKNIVSERLMGYKAMAEQPSPVSVLDAYYTEDTPSPINKTSYAFKDDEDSCFDELEWSQVDDLNSSKELNQLTSGSNDINFKNIKQHVHQIELQATINPHEGTNEDHIYIKEIILASGILKNLDFATTIVRLHPTGSLINPELFNILEKTKEYTLKSEKTKRKLIFDTVNNILVQKLSKTTCHCPGQWTSKRKEKLLEELCLEISDLRINKKLDDWEDYCSEVPALVLDIEQLVFEDLITDILNVAVSGQQCADWFNTTITD